MKNLAISTDQGFAAHPTWRRGIGNRIRHGGVLVAVVAALLATACVPQRTGEMHPAQALGIGLGYLVASPLMIVAGLMEGIVTAPYLLNADLHQMNRAMDDADS